MGIAERSLIINNTHMGTIIHQYLRGLKVAKRNGFLVWIMTLGVFGILNTEMGVIGILPLIAEHFNVSISKAGLLVALFAFAVAISGPTMPLLFSGLNRKKVMLLVLGIFTLGNVVSIFCIEFYDRIDNSCGPSLFPSHILLNGFDYSSCIR